MERPDLRPRIRRGVVAISALALATGSVGAILALRRAPTGPLIITMPSAPAPTVTVPAPIVTVTVPAPPPAPDKPTIVPRMLAPHLDAGCLLPDSSTEPTPCSWDNGFPAVSADGKLVAVERSETSPGDGSTMAVWIELLDAKTAGVVRRLDLLTPADLALERSIALARIATRTDAAQRVLDGRHYETLIALGNQDMPEDAEHVHAEFLGGQARIVDPVSATVLWQGEPGVASPTRVGLSADEGGDCGSWNLHSTRLWWRPDAKVVLGELTYFTGGCMCPDFDEFQTWSVQQDPDRTGRR